MHFYLYDSGDYLGVVRRRRASVGLSDGVRRDFRRRRDRVDCFVRARDDHVVFCKRQKVCFWFLLLVGRRRVFVSVYGRARVHGIRRHGSVRGNGFVRHRFGRRSVRREIRDEIGEFW